MNGEMIQFLVNGTSARGYLSKPENSGHPAVMVIQEWWGLAPQIKAVCDRLASSGFIALAPDLYHGEIASHTEMDKAGELMSSLPPDRAVRDMSGAIDYLLNHEASTGNSVGVVGFCMGGMLTLKIAAKEGDRVGVAVPFYGAPLGENEPDWSGMTAKVEGHFAAVDDFFTPEAVIELESNLREMNKDVVFHIYSSTGHGFANEENPLGTYDEVAASKAWEKTLKLFHEVL